MCIRDRLWEHRFLRGKINIIAGEGGEGKTTIALAVAAAKTSGGAYPDGKPSGEPGRVLIVAAEDGAADTIKPRLIAAFIGVTAALVQGGLIRPLAKRFHEAPLIRAGAMVQALAFTIIAVAPSFGRGALYVGGAVLAVGNGLSQPSLSAYVSRRADRSSQGQTLGTNQSMASLARMVGPAMGGFLYGHVGPRSPYFAAAAGMALALVLALRLRDDSGAGAAVAPTNG